MLTDSSSPSRLSIRRSGLPLLLLAITLVGYLLNAAHPALLDDADGCHAVVAREILERGDWAVLHINGIRWLEKPPLHYWLVALSYLAFGQTAFATRLPLAVATIALVLAVYAFGKRFFGARAGFYAGLVMGTSVGTFIFTRVMIPEALYALEFTLAFYLFLRAWTGTVPPLVGYWGAAACIGLAALTRAGIGILFPLGIVGIFVLLTHRSRPISLGQRDRWLMVSAVLVVLLIAAPWHIVAGLRTPGFFWFYFINEQLLRALGRRYPADYAAVPLGVWWISHLVWFFPWTLFLPYAVRETFRVVRRQRVRLKSNAAQAIGRPGDRSPETQAGMFLVIWAGLIFLFFSIVSGSRMEYYGFGAWPAVALLIGAGLARAEDQRHRGLGPLQLALAICGVAVAGVLAALVWISRDVSGSDISSLLTRHPTEFYRVSMANFFDLTPESFAALRTPAIGAGLSFASGFIAACWLRRRNRVLAAHVMTALTMVAFFVCANMAFQAFEPRLSSRALANELQKYLTPSDRLVIYGEFDAGCSLSFYTRRKAWIYNGRYNGLEYGSYYRDAPKIFLSDAEFPAIWRGATSVFLFVPPEQRDAALRRLPPESAYVVAERGDKVVYVNRPLWQGQVNLEDRRQLRELRNASRVTEKGVDGTEERR